MCYVYKGESMGIIIHIDPGGFDGGNVTIFCFFLLLCINKKTCTVEAETPHSPNGSGGWRIMPCGCNPLFADLRETKIYKLIILFTSVGKL